MILGKKMECITDLEDGGVCSSLSRATFRFCARLQALGFTIRDCSSYICNWTERDGRMILFWKQGKK